MLERRLPLTYFSPCSSSNLNPLKADKQQCTTMSEEVESQLNEWNRKVDSEALNLKRCSCASCMGRSISCSSQRYPKNPSPNRTPVTSVFYSPSSELYYQPSTEFLAEPAPVNKEKQSLYFKQFNGGKKSRMAEEGSEEDEIDSVKASLRGYMPKSEKSRMTEEGREEDERDSVGASLFGYMHKSEKSRMVEQGREEGEIDSVKASLRGYMTKSEKSRIAEEGREEDEIDSVKASLRGYMPKSEKSRMAEEGREEEEKGSVKASLRGYTPKSESSMSSRNSRDRIGNDRKELEDFLQNHHKKPQTQQKTKSVRAVQRLLRNEQDDRGTGSSCSACGDSDIESSINEHMRSLFTPQARASHPFVAEMERNVIEAKLLAWKEATILNLVNRLREKESEICNWEYKKTLKYQSEMKHFERKMLEKRQKAYLKMQQKIRETEKEAEEMKVKETEIVARKITKTSNTVDRISRRGKLQWMLLIC